jgi:peptide/nickel transport system substrate-binding protein
MNGGVGCGSRWLLASWWRSLFLAILVLGAAPAAAQQLRIGLNSDPDALDPTTSRTVAGRVVFTALCDKLIDIDANLTLVPQLATAWTWSEDGKALTLTLRPGVKFHDGETLDAAAVKYTIERGLTLPGSTRKSELGPVTGVEIVDKLTARIVLLAPFAPLAAQLADRAGMIVSPKAASAAGGNFSQHPVCAGPYEFVERVAQDRIVLGRFADYWDAGSYHFDRVTYLPIPDASVRIANLRSGGIDIGESLLPSDVAAIKADSKLSVSSGPSLAAVYLAINVGHGERAKTPLGQNARLREALELAIDRKILNDVAFDGQFVAGNQTVPPGSRWYATSLPVPGRDLARARALLKEAGLQRLRIKLTVPNTTAYLQSAQILQSMVAEAGFDLDLAVTEVTTALTQWSAGDFEALLILWSGRVDPDGNLYSFTACDGALNGGSYCNPAVDRLLTAARTQIDFPARFAAYEQAAQIYLAERPYIYLWHPALIYGVSRRLEGFRLVPDGMIRLGGLKARS